MVPNDDGVRLRPIPESTLCRDVCPAAGRNREADLPAEEKRNMGVSFFQIILFLPWYNFYLS